MFHKDVLELNDSELEELIKSGDFVSPFQQEELIYDYDFSVREIKDADSLYSPAEKRNIKE